MLKINHKNVFLFTFSIDLLNHPLIFGAVLCNVCPKSLGTSDYFYKQEYNNKSWITSSIRAQIFQYLSYFKNNITNPMDRNE